jgi:hypothetical protein
LHDKNIVHGDICPRTICMLDDDTLMEDWYEHAGDYFYQQVRGQLPHPLCAIYDLV